MNWKEFARSLRHWASGAKKSYSQTGEDIIAEFYLSKIKNGFYVDVGANDPVHLNNTYKFYNKGWRGLCVEPNASRAGLIKLRRPKDKILNLGIGSMSGVMTFFVLDPDTLSTFSETEVKEFQKLGHRLIKEEQVSVMPLRQVLEQHTAGVNIDLLSVDTEGWDLEVLKSNDWQKFRPKLVMAETAEYRKKSMIRESGPIDAYMVSQNYIKLADTYINGIYASKEFAQVNSLNSILES